MNEKEYVKSLMCWDSSTGVLGEPGYCYVSLLRVDCRVMVARLLGPMPTVASLLAVAWSVFDLDCLRAAVYSEVSGQCHVVVDGSGYFRPGPARVASSFLECVLLPASQGRVWPLGSLGASLEEGGKASSLLAWKVGAPGGSSGWTGPSGGERMSAGAYMAWVIALSDRGYTPEQVLGLVRSGLGVSAGVDDRACVDGVSRVHGPGLDHARGPNWERNRATKALQRVRRLEDRERHVANRAVDDYRRGLGAGGSGVDSKAADGGSAGVASGDWRARPAAAVRSEKEQRLHELKVERQIIQEERKLKKLTSPMQQLEDAMAMIRMSEAAAKVQNDHKVAGWAKTLSDSYAMSIARSATSSPVSIDSMGSVTSASEMPRPAGSRVSVPRVVGGSGSVVSSSSSRSGVVDHLNMSGQAAREAAATRRLKEIGLIDSEGRVFTRDTADRFVRNYACIRAVATVDKSDEEIARLTDVPVHVVRQYFLLRKEFRLK